MSRRTAPRPRPPKHTVANTNKSKPRLLPYASLAQDTSASRHFPWDTCLDTLPAVKHPYITATCAGRKIPRRFFCLWSCPTDARYTSPQRAPSHGNLLPALRSRFRRDIVPVRPPGPLPLRCRGHVSRRRPACGPRYRRFAADAQRPPTGKRSAGSKIPGLRADALRVPGAVGRQQQPALVPGEQGAVRAARCWSRRWPSSARSSRG